MRSYSGEALSSEEEQCLRGFFDEAGAGPFGGKPRFMLIHQAESGLTEKVGTYGLIKNAPAFVMGAIARGPKMNEDFGYCLEGIVLAAADQGLATCWLGGALHRDQVAALINLKENECIPAICSIGHASERRTLGDRLVRGISHAESRLPDSDLFFQMPPPGVSPAASGPGAFGEPLPPTWFDGPWGEVLEAVRFGPSASNKQPWRITVDMDDSKAAFHLYLHEDKAYNSAMGELKMQNVDMGIAMRQFEAAARAKKLPGAWHVLDKSPLAVLPPEYYIATWS